MKTFLILLAALAAGTVAAQPLPPDQTIENKVVRQSRRDFVLAKPQKPNPIIGKRFAFSGIAVQVLTTGNKAELLNPWAPEEYGSGEDNLDRDPINGKARGLRILSIRF